MRSHLQRKVIDFTNELSSNTKIVAFTNEHVTFSSCKFLVVGTRDKVLRLRGAYEENQTLETSRLRYYINKDLETELGVTVSFIGYLFDRQVSSSLLV